MSVADRVAELRSLVGPLEVPFALVHQRIDALVGRPVFTHELAGDDMIQFLVTEIVSGTRATMDDVIDKALALKGDDGVLIVRPV